MLRKLLSARGDFISETWIEIFMEELSYLEVIGKEKKKKQHSAGVIQGIFLWGFFTVEFYAVGTD